MNSELKFRIKNREKEEKKKEKEVHSTAISASHGAVGLDHPDVNYPEFRKKALQDKRDQGINPYPHKFQRTHRIDEFHKIFTERNVEPNTFFESEEVALAGRIWSLRQAGSKLLFIDLVGDESKVQVMATSANF